MTEKAGFIVSFVALLSAWIVGFAAARFSGWVFPELLFNPASPFELVWMGLACLVFGSLFFGRLGFLFFFMLGAIQSSGVSYPGMVPLFFQTLVLVWFGMLGAHIGESLYADLREKKEFDVLERQLALVFLIGIILAVLVSLLTPSIEKFGEGLVDFARKVRNGEFNLDNILKFFAPMDANKLESQNNSGS